MVCTRTGHHATKYFRVTSANAGGATSPLNLVSCDNLAGRMWRGGQHWQRGNRGRRWYWRFPQLGRQREHDQFRRSFG